MKTFPYSHSLSSPSIIDDANLIILIFFLNLILSLNLILYHLSSILSYHSLSTSHLKYNVSLSNTSEHKTYKQAIKPVDWVNTMKAELNALETSNTWYLTKLPQGKVAIDCRWVYQIKHKVDSLVEIYKAHLVAKRYTQQ